MPATLSAFALIHGDGEVTHSDTLTGLVAALIPGYGDQPDDDVDSWSLVQRIDHLARTAAMVQEGLLMQAVTAGVDLTVIPEPHLTALFGDKRQPHPVAGGWPHPVPLVVLATTYAGSGQDVPASGDGDVLVLDAATERTFLQALAHLGLVELLVDPSHVPGHA